VDVIKRLESNESQASVAKGFGVHPSAISRIMKQKDLILNDWQNNTNPDRKRKRTGKQKTLKKLIYDGSARREVDRFPSVVRC
jgi:IS30 family transposase